ncbi:DUF1826 domain-containing protein [Marinimicrobium sp. ABcell2]|uniref:DUF1826 domain-containing protein n=1 Tax=Marinimicrobium sp. ABcell2 TaxID=3069751 RepID=UPI0027AE333C|nr:DUF1826 domain-containing protein [Marinimicrobium sp. ABcell2]MDQ2076218.1 DUF1826 domain-containing protein [Marinimicrobium sp. ABcell2]
MSLTEQLDHQASDHWAFGPTPDVFTEFYRDTVSLSCWQRDLDLELNACVQNLLNSGRTLAIKEAGSPFALYQSILGACKAVQPLADDIHWLLDMYCCLFDCRNVGLRLSTLDAAMCPRFHVDRVPVRLVTTYGGPGSEWLSNHCADRTRLGAGAKGLSDAESGLMQSDADVQQLAEGEVALFKGELWENNEGRGLIHRSPALAAGERRLLVTFDVVS